MKSTSSYIVFSLLVSSVSFVKCFTSAFDLDLYESVLDAEQCRQQLDLLSNHSRMLQFLDASGKLPSGMLGGHFTDLGDYHQCLSINGIINEIDIHGKYCMVKVPLVQDIVKNITFPEANITLPVAPAAENNEALKFALMQQWARRILSLDTEEGTSESSKMRNIAVLDSPLVPSLTIAVCIPKVCSVKQAVDFLQERVPLLNVSVEEKYCRLPGDKPLTSADYVAIAIFGVIGLLLLLSTAYDLLYVFIYELEANNILRCFSLYTNTRRFLTFRSQPSALACVDGIRAISMMWVIVGHTYFLTLLTHMHNTSYVLTWVSAFSSIWINAAPITVDTFFLLSGILVVYSVIGKVSSGQFVRTVPQFYLHRLLRMFPLLAAVVLLQASLVNHMSDGPNWQTVASSTETCRQYWWSTLLHVQNYVNPSKMCLGQTWYLSVDTQLYFISPLVLIWLFRSGSVPWIALTAALLLSLVSSTVYSFMYNFSAALFNMRRVLEMGDYSRLYYFNTLTRAPPFFVGMIYGYLLYRHKNIKIRIQSINVAILWALSLLVLAFCIFSIYPVIQPEHDSQIFDNLLNAYMRAAWAGALGWMIFACVQGYGGPVNWFLSLPMWKLPARLSYAMYLIHFPLIMVANGSWVKTHYFNNGEAMYRFVADLMFTSLAAFILCITIDAPFSTLQKLLLGGGAKRHQPKAESKVNIIEDIQTNGHFKTTL